MSSDDSVEARWKRFCDAEDAFYRTRMDLFKSGADLGPFIDAVLYEPARRGTGLRLLEILPEEAIRRHLEKLVRLASWAHGDIGLVRGVLSRIDKAWLRERIETHVVPVLESGDDEEYRRIAELYQELGEERLLKEHLQRCAAHANPDVREIVEDFAATP